MCFITNVTNDFFQSGIVNVNVGYHIVAILQMIITNSNIHQQIML